MKGPRPDLDVIRLKDRAALIAPVSMEGENQVLKSKRLGGHVWLFAVAKMRGADPRRAAFARQGEARPYASLSAVR